MQRTDVCAKCGSATMDGGRLQTAREPDRVCIVMDSDPSALLLKGTEYSDLRARICSACGYVEFYATDLARLAEAYRQSQSQS